MRSRSRFCAHETAPARRRPKPRDRIIPANWRSPPPPRRPRGNVLENSLIWSHARLRSIPVYAQMPRDVRHLPGCSDGQQRMEIEWYSGVTALNRAPLISEKPEQACCSATAQSRGTAQHSAGSGSSPQPGAVSLRYFLIGAHPGCPNS